MLRPDSAGRAAFYTAALDPITGWMDRNEVRRLEDLPPEEQSRDRSPEMVAPPMVAVPTNGGTTNE